MSAEHSERTVRERLQDIAAYWCLVIKELRPSLELGEMITSVLAGLVAGAAAAFSPLPLWSVAPAFFGVVLLCLLTITPARLWQRDQQTIGSLRERLRPKLGVKLDDPQLSPDGKARFVRLHVMNQAHEQVRDCQGKLLNVKPLEPIDVTLPEPEQNLTWTTRGGDSGRTLKRSINPKSSEFLDVAFTQDFLDEYAAGTIPSTDATGRQVKQLLHDPGRSHYHFAFHDYESWNLPKGAYEVTIVVSAANVAMPTRISFRIVYEGGLNLYAEASDMADSSHQEAQ